MQRFQTCLNHREQPVQLLLPAIEIVAAMRAGVGELVRRAGLALISLLMEQEVEEVVGKRSVPTKERKAYRWGPGRRLAPERRPEGSAEAAAGALGGRQGSAPGQ